MKATIASRGMSMSTLRRLCSLAPRTCTTWSVASFFTVPSYPLKGVGLTGPTVTAASAAMAQLPGDLGAPCQRRQRALRISSTRSSFIV